MIPCSKKKCPAEVISQPAFSCPDAEQQWHFSFSSTANKSSSAKQLQAQAFRNQNLQARNEAVTSTASSPAAWHRLVAATKLLQAGNCFKLVNALCWTPERPIILSQFSRGKYSLQSVHRDTTPAPGAVGTATNHPPLPPPGPKFLMKVWVLKLLFVTQHLQELQQSSVTWESLTRVATST